MGTGMQCTAGQMLAFTICWYIFTISTYGVFVPSGLFLPGMIIGCGLGDLYIWCLGKTQLTDAKDIEEHRTTYIILGMGAMLAGYTRMTYSLVVIVMETT